MATRSGDRARGYLDALRREGVHGRESAAALLALPDETWSDALAANPGWYRVGTFQVLLDEAEEILPVNAERALTITTFVARHALRAPVPLYGWTLFAKLRCDAWVTHGSVLLARNDCHGAVDAAYLAEQSAEQTGLALHLADAKHLRARAWGKLQRDAEALDLLEECLSVYGAFGHACRYMRALGSRARLLCEMCQWEAAWHTLREAAATADDVNYPPISRAYELLLEECRDAGLPECGATVTPIRPNGH